MENEISSIKPKTILSVKILAWLDLLIGIIPTALVSIFIINLLLYYDGWGRVVGLILAFFIEPILIMNLIFGIFSFKHLRKNSLKGIKFSLIPKIIFIVVNSIYLIQIFRSGGFDEASIILILINIFLIILIGFVFFVKKQLLKSISNKK
jgi:hypothetical protein